MKERKWVKKCNKDDNAFKHKSIVLSGYETSITKDKNNDKKDMASLIADMLGISRDKVEVSTVSQKDRHAMFLDGQDGCLYETVMGDLGYHVRSKPYDRIAD